VAALAPTRNTRLPASRHRLTSAAVGINRRYAQSESASARAAPSSLASLARQALCA
jgi:hypothetical protein